MSKTFVGEWRVDAGATLKLHMLSFNNPGGKQYNGRNCDVWYAGECDHIFRFSLDRGNRYE